MKKKFYRQKAVSNLSRVLLLAFAFTLMGQGWLQGFVLCFEYNGRVNVEAVYAGQCVSSMELLLQGNQSSPISQAKLEKRHSGPCRDVPLFTNKLEKSFSLRKVTQEKGVETAIFSLPLLSYVSPEKSSRKSFVHQCAFVSSSRTSLRTVVLLT